MLLHAVHHLRAHLRELTVLGSQRFFVVHLILSSILCCEGLCLRLWLSLAPDWLFSVRLRLTALIWLLLRLLLRFYFILLVQIGRVECRLVSRLSAYLILLWGFVSARRSR